MTETDTFRILSRPSISELYILFDEEFPDPLHIENGELNKFLEKYQWTLDEVIKKTFQDENND